MSPLRRKTNAACNRHAVYFFEHVFLASTRQSLARCLRSNCLRSETHLYILEMTTNTRREHLSKPVRVSTGQSHIRVLLSASSLRLPLLKVLVLLLLQLLVFRLLAVRTGLLLLLLCASAAIVRCCVSCTLADNKVSL